MADIGEDRLPIGSSGTVATAFQFAGQYTDSESDLQYLRSRYYDPATQEFLTVDPLVSQMGEPYVYGGNDPLNLVDPARLCPANRGNPPDNTVLAPTAGNCRVRIRDVERHGSSRYPDWHFNVQIENRKTAESYVNYRVYFGSDVGVGMYWKITDLSSYGQELRKFQVLGLFWGLGATNLATHRIAAIRAAANFINIINREMKNLCGQNAIRNALVKMPASIFDSGKNIGAYMLSLLFYNVYARATNQPTVPLP